MSSVEKRKKKAQKTSVGKDKEEEVVDEEEEEEEEEQLLFQLQDNDDDGDVPERKGVVSESEILRLFEEAEKEFEAIRGLQHHQQRQPGGNGSFDQEQQQWEGPPNVQELIASTTLADVDCLLASSEAVAVNSLEGRASLSLWWRSVKRYCKVRGVFQLLRAQMSNVGTMRERYQEILNGLAARGHGDTAKSMLSFAQASRYERIGKFLSEYPMFIYQRKWVTQADWFQKVEFKAWNGKGNVVLLDCLPSLVPVSSVFLRDSFKLHEHGFEVLPAMMKDLVSEELINVCKTRCHESGEAVFNNHKDATSRHNDGMRVQLAVDKVGGEAMARFKAVLTERLSQRYPAHQVDAMVALLSKLLCKAQLAHADYTPAALGGEEALCLPENDGKVPLACLVALLDGTALDVWPCAIRFDSSRKLKPMRVILRAGDVLIFRGDLVHGGAALVDGEAENVRIHAYLDAKGMERPKHNDGVEMTHFMYHEKYILKRMN